MDPLRQAKDRATELTLQGKLPAALEQWQRVVKASPQDIGARQKVADLLHRLGRNGEAITDYLDVVNRYAHGGEFFKAIALCKVILGLDPEHVAAQAYISDLYSRTRPAPKARPSAPQPPMAPLELDGFAATPAAPALTPANDDDLPLIELDPLPESEQLPPSMVGGDLPVIPLFSQLNHEEFMAVLGSGLKVRSYDSGAAIVTEGEPGTGMFAIVQGTVAVMHADKKVAQMAESDFFGEMAMLSSSKRLATVLAETSVVALEFPRDEMERLFTAHPGVAVALDAFYRERLLANLLRCSPLLAPLTEDEKVELSGKFEVKTFDMGHVILVQGQPGDGLYLIIRGKVGVMDRSGKRYPPLAEGDAFGEISVATGHAVTANVRAETQVVALRLPTDVVRAHVLTHPGVKPLLDGLIEERLARTRSMDLRV